MARGAHLKGTFERPSACPHPIAASGLCERRMQVHFHCRLKNSSLLWEST